jgi:hypothetical protein
MIVVRTSTALLCVACSTSAGSTSDGGPEAAYGAEAFDGPEGSDGPEADGPSNPFTCAGTWVCVADTVSSWTLTDNNGECDLVGTSMPTTLEPDGTLVRDGAIVGHASGSGDSVEVNLDGVRYACRGATDSTMYCSPTCGR